MNKTTSSSLRVVSTNSKGKKNVVSMSISSPNVRQDIQMLGLLSSAARKREVKATQNLSIIVLFFIICWIVSYHNWWHIFLKIIKIFCHYSLYTR